MCVLLASCGGNTASNNTGDITFDGTTVSVSDGSPVHSKIKIQTVEPTDYSASFNTTGIVRPVNGHMAEIAPLFDGRVTRTPLFELNSARSAALQSELEYEAVEQQIGAEVL